MSGLSGSPLKSLSPMGDRPAGSLPHRDPPSRRISPSNVDVGLAGSSGTSGRMMTPGDKKTGLTQKAGLMGIKATPKGGHKRIPLSMDLFGSYDVDGKPIQKNKQTQDMFKSYDKDGIYIGITQPSPGSVVDLNGKNDSTLVSETQGLAAQCTGISQDEQDSEGALASSPTGSVASSGSNYSNISQKSAPAPERGPEMLLEALKENDIPLLRVRNDKRALLHGKDVATVSQILEAYNRTEVSIPGGRTKQVLALLRNAAEYESLKKEKVSIKWSRSRSQWQ